MYGNSFQQHFLRLLCSRHVWKKCRSSHILRQYGTSSVYLYLKLWLQRRNLPIAFTLKQHSIRGQWTLNHFVCTMLCHTTMHGLAITFYDCIWHCKMTGICHGPVVTMFGSQAWGNRFESQLDPHKPVGIAATYECAAFFNWKTPWNCSWIETNFLPIPGFSFVLISSKLLKAK